LGFVHGGHAYAQDPAPKGSFRTSFDRGGDHIAACNLGILVAEDKGGLVEIYWPDGQVFQRIRTSFDKGGDGLACGDVDGDGAAEVLVVEDKNGAIDLYSAERGGLKIATFGAKDTATPSTYDKGGDGFAAGDVDGDGRAEILVAEDKGGEVQIFDVLRPDETPSQMWQLKSIGTLKTSFDEGGDGLAVCDLIPDPDGLAEILVAEDKGGKVEIYSLRGGKQINPIWTNFDKGGDGLACGNVDSILDEQPEILVAEDKGGEVTIYSIQ
jgi:hypothetical protein